MQKEYTKIRQIYAWIGFVSVLCAVIAVFYLIGYVFTHTERAEAFYQQAASTGLCAGIATSEESTQL